MSDGGARAAEWESLLVEAYLRECSLYARMGFVAKAARKEGLVRISAVLEETAAHDRSHAKRLFKLLRPGPVRVHTTLAEGGLGTTEDNLDAALASKRYLADSLYPALAEAAREASQQVVAAIADAVSIAERHHVERLGGLLDALRSGRVFERDEPHVWRCRKCGYVQEARVAPKACPACAHPRAWFEAVDDSL